MTDAPNRDPAATPGHSGQPRPAAANVPAGQPDAAAADAPADGPAPPAGTPPAGQASAPEQDPHERIDGLRAWLAQLDHTVTVRTWVLGIVMLLTLAVAVAGLVIGLQLRGDHVGEDDLDDLSARITAIESQVSSLANAPAPTYGDELTQLGDRVDNLARRIRRVDNAQEANGSELGDLDDRVGGLGDDLDDLSGRADDLQSAIDALEAAQQRQAQQQDTAKP